MGSKKKKNQIRKHLAEKERSKITDKLYRDCIFGGNLNGIKKTVSEYDFTISELEKAIEILTGSCYKCTCK